MTDLLEKWTCPKCGASRIEEIMTGVTVTSRIINVPDNCTDFDFGTQLNEDGEVERYQCERCGRTIASSPEDLVRALGGKVDS